MNAESSNPYSKDYLRWKEWGRYGSFGNLENYMRVYYSAEIKNSKLNSINNVIEIGFGNGSFLSFCRENSWRSLGTEVNQDLVALACERGFEAIPADQLELADANYWDLIVAFDVLEHVDQVTLFKMLTEIRRLLRPGGVFMARFPNGDSPMGLQIQHGDITHITTLGSGKIEYIAKTLDFEIVSLQGAIQPIFGFGFLKSLRRLFVVPIKYFFEVLFKNLFFPGTRVAYLSPSLVVCLRKPQHISVDSNKND